MTRSDSPVGTGPEVPAVLRRLGAPVLIGIAAGFLSGLFGVGGGILIVPALVVFLAMPQRLAHGTSLACTILISLVGVAGYLAASAVDVALAALIFVGSSVGVVGGTLLLDRLSQRALRLAFVGILLTTAVRLAFAIPESLATADITPLLVLGAVALGLVTGILSGLLGVGGGIVIVPALVLLFGVGDVVAKGTSLLVIIPTALIGTLRNRGLGNADLGVALLLSLAGTLTALLGVRVATRLDPQVSTLLLAALLLVTALRLIWSEVADRRRSDPPQLS